MDVAKNNVSFDGLAFMHALSKTEKPPCIGCKFYMDCKMNKRACLYFHNYVYQYINRKPNLRAKAFYDFVLDNKPISSLLRFIQIVDAAHQSATTAVFYDYSIKKLITIDNCENDYKSLDSRYYLKLIGFFGPEFTKQDIADYIDQGTQKCLH